MKKLLLFVAISCISMVTFAQFSGSGSGTKADPYLIFNPIQLDQVRNFPRKSVYFKLMADIDLTEFINDNYPTEGWLPIGNSYSSAFGGNFNGNGKTISGLWINRPNEKYVGLFGYVYCEKSSTIENLTVKGIDIKGDLYVGGLAGAVGVNTYEYSSGCGSCAKVMFKTYNVAVSGNVEGDQYVGGLIGLADVCTIDSCMVVGNVRGIQNIGGLVGGCEFSLGSEIEGKNRFAITRNVNLVTVTATGKIVNKQKIAMCGGLIGSFKCNKNGYCHYGISIAQNYVNGIIEGEGNYAGGVVGMVSCDAVYIENNYYVGNLKTYNSNSIGGIVGAIGAYRLLKMCSVRKNYSKSSIVGTDTVGGIVGRIDNNTYVESNIAMNPQISSFESMIGKNYGAQAKRGSNNTIGDIGTAQTNKSLTTTKVIINDVEQSNIGDDIRNGQSIGKTLLQYKASYMGINWDFTNIWDIQETESFPYLSYQCAPPTIDVSTVISGNTTLSGRGVEGATIVLQVGNKQYQTICSKNVWTLSLPALVAGTKIEAYATMYDKRPSYVVSITVSYLGSGTEADPWQVYTAEELANINGMGYFQLMNDIDLSHIENWTPIGTKSNISGDFNGKNHIIQGLSINNADENQGLFGSCNELNIHDLRIMVKKIIGGNNTAALAAKLSNSTITNCHITGGSIKGSGKVGALVAIAQDCKIEGCSTENNISGGDYVGGIAGSVSGSINQCFTEGVLISSTSGSIVGGLVGSNQATINDCYSVATVYADNYAGGLIGYNYGVVANCYATGNLTSTNHAGGVIGYNDGESATVKNCCAMNNKIDVSSSNGSVLRVIGGIKNGAPTPELNNYALKAMAVSINNIPQKIYDDNLNGVAKIDATLKQESFYFLLGWDMEQNWCIRDGESYPLLMRFIDEPIVKSLHLSDENTIYRAGTYAGGLDYTRDILDGDRYISFCLPFDVSVNNNTDIFTKLYTPLGIAFQYRNSQNEEVMKVFFVGVDSVEAGNPFVAQLNTGLNSSITVVANKDSISSETTSNADIIYPYEYNSADIGSQVSIPMSGHLTFYGTLTSMYIQDAMILQPNGEFSVVETPEIVPFHTYLTISRQLLSKSQRVLAFVSEGDNISTAIMDFEKEMGSDYINVYSLDGKCLMQSISKAEALKILEKGIYLFNQEKIVIQ